MSIPIRALHGVGEAVAQLLAKLSIHHSDDLLFHLPRDYEDRSRIIAMADVQVGHSVLLEGSVQAVESQNGRRPSLAVKLSDGSGQVTLRFYHVYNGLKEKFGIGQNFRVFGEIRLGARGIELYHPEVKAVSLASPLPAAQLSAIYPTTEGLSQTKLRSLVDQALTQAGQLPELLPEPLTQAYQLHAALRYVHQPPLDTDLVQLSEGRHPAQQRLIIEELIAHQVSLLSRRQFVQAARAPACPLAKRKRLDQQLLSVLPFKPTRAQKRVSAEIAADLAQPQPMLRLVQGDVGSGKTLVAALAACQALQAGYQVALMAPTELLAEQHLVNFTGWLEPFGIQVGWLSGKQKGKARQAAEQAILDGSTQLVIGTHALFQDSVQFARLGLVIIDEQHRFGVDQRLALREKAALGMSPHQLVMTATPIPRTLAMSVYGDLDTSIIDELPKGRSPITTVAVPFGRRADVIERVAANCSSGRQAYWVCTLVEQSESLDAQAAEQTYAELCLSLPHLQIGLVHGRMKSDEKQQVMHAFKANQLQLLIATTVIEVGVDVPNASLMIIENAERLGLSQLHQLRGRVGRGSIASYCVLLYKAPLSANGTERLRTLRESTDGFVIAEKDLELRGPGELLGTRQTGVLDFRVAQLERDQHLLATAQQAATVILRDYPQQVEPLLQRWLPDAPRYARV